MKRKDLSKLVLMVGMATIYSSSSFAATSVNESGTEVKTFDMPDIIVTSQRTETAPLETPAAVTVLTSKEIRQTGAHTIFDAISFATGLTNFSYGAGGLDYGAMDSRVNVRGLERGASILLNGAPISLNGKNTISGIPIDRVERVEIVKGAASALYGAEALSGVINIITKDTYDESGSASLTIGNRNQKKI